MKKILVLIALIACSCRERIITKSLSFEGEKLVVFSYLQPEKPFLVHVSKTDVPNYNQKNKVGVSKAKVTVFEGDKIIEVLTEVAEGTYSSIKNEMPTVGKFYRIEVEKEGFLKAVSSPTAIPFDNIKTFNVNLKKNLTPVINESEEQVICGVEVDQKLNSLHHYIIKYEGILDGKKDYLQWFGLTQNPNEYNLKCYDRVGIPHYELNSSGFVFTDKCILNKPLEIQNSIIIVDQSKLPRRRLEKVLVSVGTISEEYFKFIQNQYQPEDIERLFLDPKTTYTNIKNGYGVVAAINLKTKEFSL